MRVVIAGSRPPKAIAEDEDKLERWYEERYEVLEATIAKCGFGELIEVVVSGTAVGWDTLGERWAMANGKEVERHPAKWRGKDGKGPVDMGAGMKRNREMARADTSGLIAFWDGKSHGARNMIFEAEKAGMEEECVWVEVVDI